MKKSLPSILAFLLLICQYSLGFSQTILLQENFSTASGETPPSGWSTSILSGFANEKWRFDNPGFQTINSPVSGTFAMFDSDYYGSTSASEDAILESPAFNASTYTILKLDFDHYFLEGYGGAYSVDVYNGTTWTSVSSGTTSTVNAASFSLDILSAAGGYSAAKVRFRWTGDYSYFWAVDNIVVTGDFIADLDGDGIADSEDLDDDNDGIPDWKEAGTTCIETIVLTGGTGGKIYQTNLITGVTTLYTTSNLVTGSINGLAANPDAGVLYYGSDRSVYVYNPNTNTHALVQDLTGLITGQALESGGAAYYNGYLYIGTEGAAGGGDIVDIFRIPLATDGLSFTANPIALSAENSQGGFGDFVIKSEGASGVIYASTSSNQLWTFNLATATYTSISTGGSTFQMAVDFSGQVWGATGTTLRKLDANGSPYGSTFTLPESAIDMTGPFNCPQPDYNKDNDGDGIPNYQDLDSDNDGIPDIVEAGGVDANGDGVIDYPTPGDPTSMADTDGDGLANVYDTDNSGVDIPNPDTDGDGISDIWDLDADGDGIPDIIEAGGIDMDGNGRVDVDVSLLAHDADGDGYADIYDSDDDGIAGIDAGESTQPLTLTTDAGSDGLYDTITKGDGTSLDSDGDGYADGLDLDADKDGIPDIIEAKGIDSNGDGRVDVSTDVDGDGLADVYDSDASDGPAGNGSNGSALVQTDGTDTNGDYKADDAAIILEHGDGTVLDTDSDGIPEYLDLDADRDGIPDIIEAGGVDANGDGRTDTSTDIDQDGLVDIYDSNASDGPGSNGTNGSALVQTNGTDTDADGIADDIAIVWEHGNGTDIDADGDGLPEFIDLDADNDGIPDVVEAGGVDANGDGHPELNTDADGDGLVDIFDSNASDGPAGSGTNGVALVQTNGTDTGADGLADGDASVGYIHGGSATDIDTDGDDIPDWLDIDADNDGNPDVIEAGGLDTNGDGYADPSVDADNDGLVDAYDSNASDGPGGNGTNGSALVQTAGTDTGSDGLADGDAAIAYQSGSNTIWPDWDGDGVPNHLDPDADNDGIADIIESGGVDSDRDGRVDGVFTDTDKDGFSNTFDADNSGTAIINTGADTGSDNRPDSYSDDVDADVHPNFLDVDADNDGLLDNLEAQTTPAYLPAGSTDSDGDGILDEYDGGNFIVPTNTDLTGLADFLDTDADDDGLLDKNEAWDSYSDGDASSDLTCSTDADNDGLLDCYDNDVADITDQRVGVTPPIDNGFDGLGYTNSQTSTGTTAEDIYPNNAGAEAEPDWRDNDHCALSPLLVYPITGTGYLFSGGTHSLNSASTGTVRSTNYCEDAISAGYTYYYPAVESDKLLFSIDHSTNNNTTTIDYVELRRDEAANRTAISGSQGYFVMGRDWFVQTVNDDPLTGNVNVRFYFDPADSLAMATLANSFSADKSGVVETPKWFKVDNKWSNSDISAETGLSHLPGYVELSGSYGTEAGLHYVQFDNVSGFSGGGLLTQVSGTLPLELADFSAEAKPSSTELSWSTLSELNTHSFEIERSQDGNIFQTIGGVEAAGESQELLNYSFTDNQAHIQNNGKWIYRLKMLDIDGSFTYSHLVEVRWEKESLSLLEVYPNPGREKVEIQFEGIEPEQLKAIDMTGKVIWLQDIEKDIYKGTVSVEVSDWACGVYLIQLQTKFGAQQIRFLKQ